MTEPGRQPLIYVDSMVFIYALEGNAANGPPARDLFRHLRNHPGAALTSELSLAEVLAPTSLRGKIPDALIKLEPDVDGVTRTLEALG